MFDRPELNNSHYDDCYFSYDEGLEEARYVFVEGNGFPDRVTEEPLIVGETGFGTGLNLIALLEVLEATTILYNLTFYSVEKYPLSPARIQELFGSFKDRLPKEGTRFLAQWELCYPTLTAGWNSLEIVGLRGSVLLHLFVGDVTDYFEAFPALCDAWFLDGHSPDKNPDMWNERVFAGVGSHTKPGGTVATFSAAGIVKEGLRSVGFFIKRRKGFGGKRHMSLGWRE